VERANQTLQDRLIKELRLQGINDLDAANALVDQFMAEYNARFAVAPQNHANAHRAVHHNAEEQALILSLHHQRKLSKPQLPIQNREYQLQGQGHGYRLRGATLTLCEIFGPGYPATPRQNPALSDPGRGRTSPPRWMTRKSIHQTVDQAKARQNARPHHKPAPDHPWRQRARIAMDQAAQK